MLGNNTNSPQRWVVFKISPKLLIGDLSRRFLKIHDPFPLGAQVIRAGYDSLEDAFVMVVSSAEFPEVPPGCALRVIAGPAVENLETQTCTP